MTMKITVCSSDSHSRCVAKELSDSCQADKGGVGLRIVTPWKLTTSEIDQREDADQQQQEDGRRRSASI